MASPAFISKLSSSQRRLLISHIEGPQPIERTGPSGRGISSVDCLLRAGLLRAHPVGVVRPKFTDLSESGRNAVAKILSEYAEALIAVGCLEIDPALPSATRPIKMLSRIKNHRSSHIRGLGKVGQNGENNPSKAVDNG